jgi:hypothetical protein
MLGEVALLDLLACGVFLFLGGTTHLWEAWRLCCSSVHGFFLMGPPLDKWWPEPDLQIQTRSKITVGPNVGIY